MPDKPIKVGIIGYASNPSFHGYAIRSFDPESYFDHPGRSLHRLVMGGLGEASEVDLLYTAHGLERLYRGRNPRYLNMVSDFLHQFAHYDVLIMSRFNPIHPEIIHHELKYPLKILGFVDDPHSSYLRGVPYLWAFDAAFYISPSYDERTMFADKLRDWGCARSKWWPLSNRRLTDEQPDDAFFADRRIELCYVGGAYGDKIDRLRVLKKRFGEKFRIHGRWPAGGYIGMVRGVFGKPIFIQRVKAISEDAKQTLYTQTRIGLNMHLSDVPRETGNLRMYEVPAYGMMQICDRAGNDAHERIFREDVEAAYYTGMDEAIHKIEHFLKDDEARIRIAKAGYTRVGRDYWWMDNLKKTLDWAVSLRADRTAGAAL